MSEGRNGHARRRADEEGHDPEGPGSRVVFGAFWALMLLGTLGVTGPWAGFHGALLGCVGLLMLCCPPVVAVPRLWWLLAAGFVLAGSAALLPAGWFGMPQWRLQLEALGVPTGSLVAIQSGQAAETLGVFAVMLGVGLWLAGHRPSPGQARLWALAFTLGVAAYAIIARLTQAFPHGEHPGGEPGHFGFFPNRNHTATYLAMGAICGLGNVLQALRDKRFIGMIVALAATGVCLWAVAGWSVSRGGVLLVAVGCLVWLPLLGRRYLGKHGVWALGLLGLTVIGTFLIVDSGVKARLTKTVATVALPAAATTPMEGAKPELDSAHELDFRVPTALDTLGLIRDFPWTGIGAGQFRYVFPQYRNLTAVANDADSFHPESDWLWMAAEAGVPATLALAALVLVAFRKSLRDVLTGRDRALRSACLIAAMLVPFHGLFDVPGHRITLAWSAVFLFALSLRVPAADAPPERRPHAWPFRLAALALLGVAAWLLRAEWGGGAPPALVAGDRACAKAMSLYNEDRALQQQAAATTAGSPQQPAGPEDDRLEQALEVLRQAQPKAPLDRRLYHLQGFLALHFDDKNALVQRAFKIERALDPTWVAAPMHQATAWLTIDPDESFVLWDEALRRARRLDQLQPDLRFSAKKTGEAILQQVHANPALERQWRERAGGQH